MMRYERAAKNCHFLFFFRKKIIQKIQIDLNFFSRFSKKNKKNNLTIKKIKIY